MTQESIQNPKLDEETRKLVEEFETQVQPKKHDSEFIVLKDQERATFYFSLKDPNTKKIVIKGTDRTTGEPYENERFNFVVWHQEKNQNGIFPTSKTLARDIFDKIKEYDTIALTVKRRGTKKEDTKYDVMPMMPQAQWSDKPS